MDSKVFKENLGRNDIPDAMEQLIHFQNNISGFEYYAQGFGLFVDNKSGLRSWSENEAFLERLIPFAQANGSGSFYTFWDNGTGKPLEAMPILVFGDEGGVHIVAEDFRQLLQLLTYDTEISVDFETAYFYKHEEDHEPSDDQPAFREWLKENCNLDPVQEPNQTIKAAQDKYQQPFEVWFKQYYSI
ncbi:hypothetical protein [Taibaiella koreensis]|uniref:hypothetical protein n=1 Tax=Taibaiella koreensis TaxID=1268548 RepID=UPI000E59DF04|nr:hypothetical protein [Taibaiella koreensis]